MPLSLFQPERYDDLLAAKIEEHWRDLKAMGAPEPKIFTSPREGYRLRAEFRIWHDGDAIHYAMFHPETPKQPIYIDEFPIASPKIQRLMPALLQKLSDNALLKSKLFQVEFLTTLAGDALVSLIYHRPLGEDWDKQAQRLARELGLCIVGRSRKQKKVIGRDWVDEALNIAGQTFHYRQPEQAFTQPNGLVNTRMIEWALTQGQSLAGDLLELYCGIGNFTLPLAQCFPRVLATEVSKVAIGAALANKQRNTSSNVNFARLSAEEMSAALAGERPFRRLAQLQPPLAEHHLETLLVDPPRAGLDRATLHIAREFQNVLYISCNPKTLKENLRLLQTSHTIEALAFFDQFPYTSHLESGVLLRKRTL